VRFERNDGQTDSSVAFVSRGRDHTLFLSRNEAVMVLRNPTRKDPGSAIATLLENGDGRDSAGEPEAQTVLRMRCVGATSRLEVEGEDYMRSTANYFIGNEPALWRTNVPTCGKVRYRGIYPGIDLVFYGKEGQLEYDFVVKPGADPGQIALSIEGADAVEISPAGDLRMEVAGRELFWRKPMLYQEVGGVRVPVEGDYVLLPRTDEKKTQPIRTVAFRVAPYTPTLALVIDPLLAYSTYFGGGGNEREEQTIAVDKQGNVYMAGVTASIDFPAKAPLQSSAPGGETDAYVAKFNSAGQLLFSTYLGGSAGEVIGRGGSGFQSGPGIALTTAGDCYLVGSTQSKDFPLVHPLQAELKGGYDVFVASLRSDGSALLFSTYLGGRGDDRPLAVSAGPGDDLYVSGCTESTDFPITNAFQARLSSPSNGWQQPDGFLTRFEAGGKSLRYSTYYGWYGTAERASGLAVDTEGNAYVAVLVAKDLQGQWVIAKITEDGRTRTFERRWPPLMASYPIQLFLLPPQLALAPNGRLVLAAPVELDGELLPAMNEPDPSISSWSKLYIALFDTTNGDYISAVYLGGIGNNDIGGLCVDATGDIIVAGGTSSQPTENGTEPSGFPVTDPLEQGPPPDSVTDGFVTKYRSSDLSMVFSTLLGGAGSDSCSGLALGSDGSAWVVGSTTGPFLTANGFQPQFGGGSADAFLAKISFGDELRISLAGQTVTLSWPAQATNYVLEATSSFPAVSWDTVTNTPTVTAAGGSVQLPARESAQFFRLRKQ
jgi:hypothetical protein